MKFIFCQILRHNGHDAKPVKLATVENLSDFGYFQRSTIREHLQFATRTFAKRTKEGQRQTVFLEEIPYCCHIHHRFGGLVCVSITDTEYPERVIFSYMQTVLKNFKQECPHFKSFQADQDLSVSSLEEDFTRYQTPEEADQICQIQNNLDTVKDVMHKNIEEVLERGENLDRLMQKSEDLSSVSYQFYRKARSANSCCPI